MKLLTVVASTLIATTAAIGYAQPSAKGHLRSTDGATVTDSSTSLPWSNGNDDPIGLERSDETLGSGLVGPRRNSGEAAKNKKGTDAGTTEAQFPRGEIVSGLSSIREARHQTSARFWSGYAIVTEHMLFSSFSDVPAELCYRQAVPVDTALISVEACNRSSCREGKHEPESTPSRDAGVCARLSALDKTASLQPTVRASLQTDARGQAVMIRAAAVKKGEHLRIRLQYLTRAPMYAGVSRVKLPARGTDARAAPAEKLTADIPLDRMAPMANEVTTQNLVDASFALEFADRTAFSASTNAQTWSFPCEKRHCAEVRVLANPKPATPFDLVLAIDVSPSTNQSARPRLPQALALLLAAAPSGTRVRALSFAARTRVLNDRAVDVRSLPLSQIAGAGLASDLGSATRLDAVWHVTEPWFKAKRNLKLKPLIVLIGDGDLTEDDEFPLARLRRAGVELSILNIGNAKTRQFAAKAANLTGGVVVDAGVEAEQIAGNDGGQAFEERITELFAPIVARQITLRVGTQSYELGPLRAGRDISWEGSSRAPGVQVFGVGKQKLPSALPTELTSALANRIMASDVSRRPATNPSFESTSLGAGMPASPLLSMLRQRVLPVARGCFRKDRAGRADYSKRVTFFLRLARQEVIASRIEGSIKPEFKKCLATAIDDLDIPLFYGTVAVSYPLVTQAEPTSEPIELSPEVAQYVEEISSQSTFRP
jgi:hypothetical protein